MIFQLSKFGLYNRRRAVCLETVCADSRYRERTGQPLSFIPRWSNCLIFFPFKFYLKLFYKSVWEKKRLLAKNDLNFQKEEKQRIRERSREEKISPPVVRFDKKERKSTFSLTTSTLKSPNRSSTPIHKFLENQVSPSVLPKGYASIGPHLQVQSMWILAILRRNQSKAAKSDTESIKFPFDDTSVVTPTPIPRARRSILRLSTSIVHPMETRW